MKARLLKKWGTNYAGQVLTNVEKGSIPAGVAEFYEDDDPAVNTVREPGGNQSTHPTVINDEVDPDAEKAHAESQRAQAKRGEEADQGGRLAAAAAEADREMTQKRAREADLKAARMSGATSAKGKGAGETKGAKKLTAKQKAKAEAGK